MGNLRAWHEKCRPFCDPPDAIETVENLQKQHIDMGSHYKGLFDDLCYHGNKMLEIMKEPTLLTRSGESEFRGDICGRVCCLASGCSTDAICFH